MTPERGRGWRWGPELLSLGIVTLVFALPLRGLMRAPGPPMEEGFMLVFPEQVLKGAIANKDFLHLYGPGSLWVLAGIFKVFGVSLWSQRVFGLFGSAAEENVGLMMLAVAGAGLPAAAATRLLVLRDRLRPDRRVRKLSQRAWFLFVLGAIHSVKVPKRRAKDFPAWRRFG